MDDPQDPFRVEVLVQEGGRVFVNGKDITQLRTVFEQLVADQNLGLHEGLAALLIEAATQIALHDIELTAPFWLHWTLDMFGKFYSQSIEAYHAGALDTGEPITISKDKMH